MSAYQDIKSREGVVDLVAVSVVDWHGKVGNHKLEPMFMELQCTQLTLLYPEHRQK